MATRNHHEVTDQEIRQFNLTSEHFRTREFSRKEMLEQLKDKLNYCSSDAMLRALCSGPNAPIIRVKRGVYAFNPKPVYRERLQTCWDEYTDYNKQCDNKSLQRKLKISEEDAIACLKAKGYKIYKPNVTYKEI